MDALQLTGMLESPDSLALSGVGAVGGVTSTLNVTYTYCAVVMGPVVSVEFVASSHSR